MQLKGKQVKNYIIGDVTLTHHSMHLLAGKTLQGQDISILMIDKAQMDQPTFVAYVNMLQENVHKMHPRYYEPIQSSNNIYVVLEKVQPLQGSSITYQQVLASLVDLYQNIGEYKVELGELFVTNANRIVYLPFYKYVQTSSKFYAQFHNKSILGELFSQMAPLSNKNRALEIFIQNIDAPTPYDNIVRLVESEGSHTQPKYPSIVSPQNPKVSVFKTKMVEPPPKEYPSFRKEESRPKQSMFLTKMMEQPKVLKQDKVSYPSLTEDEKDDEEILQLMAEASVNNNMKENAAMFQRQSVRQFEQKSDKEIHNIMELAQSKMPVIKKASREQSQHFKTKMEAKVSTSKMEGDQFDTYFITYFESLRFLKKAVKVFLINYKGGFSGVISAYLTELILTLKKVYMIQDLECGRDIFNLGIDMVSVNVRRYIAIISQGLAKEAKMITELRSMLQNCQMPYKTFEILAPFLEEDLSLVDVEQLQSFTFFFMTALIKGREKGRAHFVYFIDVMQILLHKNYEIVFFESDFPNKWDGRYFDNKTVMIQAILPGWSID